MLKEVKIKEFKPLEKPGFIKTQRVIAERDGQEFSWEMVKQHDSVHILVINSDNDSVLLVKQVRIPVLVNNPESNGEMIECCAGIVDKYEEIEDETERATKIAIEEVREELGYTITDANIEFIKKTYGSPGTSGASQYIFIAEVTNDKYIGQQLTFDEDIEVVEVPVTELSDFISDANTTSMALMLTSWVIMND